MQGRMQSDAVHSDEEEELIEEDICGHEQSPPTKLQTGQKAKALFQGQQVPAFRSTGSDVFNMDTMMTGFGNTQHKNGATSPYTIAGGKDNTPFHDKSSILASKPQIGGTKYGRHQLVKSPDSRSVNMLGKMDSEMRHGPHYNGIEEEIELDCDYGEHHQNMTID